MKIILAILLAALSSPAFSKLNILCTTQDLAAVAKEVGGDAVEVQAICAPDRDPHYLEAKPSYMLKASHADLVFSTGLELEVGWLPSILRGGRNPKVMPGSPGYVEAGSFIEPLEVAKGAVSRADGDVHPSGNPHFMLDPIRAGQVALGLAQRLGELDAAHAQDYKTRAEGMQTRLTEKSAAWAKRVKASGVTKAFTYHKTLVYFFERYGLENAGNLEPKPGIPPTANHLLELIQVAKDKKVGLIMVENYFDLGAARKIADQVPGLRIALAPVMPGALGTDPSLDAVDEALVKIVEGK